MKNKIVFIISLMLVLTVNAQTVESILIKVKNTFTKKTNYKINVDYTLYRGRISSEKLSSYNGNLIFKNNISYNKINNTETITIDNKMLKASHDEKIIYYSNKENTSIKNKEFDLTLLLKILEKGKLMEDEENWVCELLPKKNSTIPYAQILIYINKKTFVIKKQVMLLKNKTNFSNNREDVDMDYVRLEINYYPLQKLNNKDDFVVNISRFINLVGDKVFLKNQYKNYQLIINN